MSMTQEQIERYEMLREAKHDVEGVLAILDDGSFDCFCAALKALPSIVTPDCRAYRYINSKMIEDRLKCFFKTQLSEINTLIEGL